MNSKQALLIVGKLKDVLACVCLCVTQRLEYVVLSVCFFPVTIC